jgi:glycosyltransferase involved in cell wall biosynthesis
MLGEQPFPILLDHFRRARAFVFAAEEDFGIVPVEAQSCGTPVIAFSKGGAVETIRGLDHPEPSGVFFGEQSVPAIQAAVETFEREVVRINPEACRRNALRFQVSLFREAFGQFVQQRFARFRAELGHLGD